MSEYYKKFKIDSNNFISDESKLLILKNNINNYKNAFNNAKKQYLNLEIAKRKASVIRYKSIESLEKLLIEFESNFEKNGGKVIWALDGQSAVNEIINIIKKNKSNFIVKTKSVVTEEIDLNNKLKESGIETFETNLGEFLIQISDEKSLNSTAPAINKSKEQILKHLNEKFNLPIDSKSEHITDFVRKKLREKFFKADVAITGANFLIADTGSISITENEGNSLLCATLPKIHIVVASIEKIIPNINNLDLLLPLLSTFETGQTLSNYTNIISGPKQNDEIDGPENMYVIIIDNGRTNLLAKPELRSALNCIKCGACLNNCTIYGTIGEHSYNTTYTGPIGAIITPIMKVFKDFDYLNYTCLLCKNCNKYCPVKINLSDLILLNRNYAVKNKYVSFSQKKSMLVLKYFLLKRKRIDKISKSNKQFILNFFVKNKKAPIFANKTFKQMFTDSKNGIGDLS